MPAEKLAYQNRFVKQLVQELQGYEASTSLPQVISGPDNIIILQVSLEEWVKILSSVFTGADFCYPEESDTVRWSLLRAVEQPMDLCALIADCIANNPATKQAIIDMLKDSEEFNTYLADKVTALTEGMIKGKVVEGSCDNSVLAGKVIAIVERMDEINQDFFEIVEVGTNDEEKVSAVLSAIPGVGETPANEILDFLQDVLEDFQENYAAAVTEAWKDGVSRELYCLAKEQEDCSLTFEQIFNYFQERVGSELTIGSFIYNVINFVIDGDFNTDELVASGIYAMQLGFLLAGREFAGMNVPLLQALTSDAAPSNRWEFWDPCPAFWCFTIDLKASNGSASGVVIGAPEFPYSLWVSGTGVRSTDPLDRVWFGQNMPSVINLDEVTIEWEYVPGEEFSPSNVWIGYNGSEGSPTAIAEDQTSFTRSGLTGVEDLIFILERSGSNETRLANITRITLKGTGDIPPIFGTSNC